MISTPQASIEIFPVVGVATVEIGGHPNLFDCITDLNDSSGLRWTKRRFNIGPIPDGSRLDLAGIRHSDLGVYTCWDQNSNDNVSINITDCT